MPNERQSGDGLTRRQRIAVERLTKFAVEWGVMVGRGAYADEIYELHPGDPRHATCRASDIAALLEIVEPPSPNRSKPHDQG